MTEEMDIDGMIAALEMKIAAMQDAVASLRKAKDALVGAGSMPLSRVLGPEEIQPDSFVGMTIADAAEKYLKMVGRPPRSTQDIVDALTRGGLQRVSPASVATILTRVNNNEGPVVRVQKGLWGLAEWYPKRPPKVRRTPVPIEEDEEQQAEIREMIGDEEKRRKNA